MALLKQKKIQDNSYFFSFFSSYFGPYFCAIKTGQKFDWRLKIN